MSTEQELRMYIVVNNDIGMGKGKIASQVGHAVMLVVEYLIKHEPDSYQKYKASGMPKIVLKADAEMMQSLTAKSRWIVHDAGRTQIELGTLTTIGFPPMTEADRDKFHPELVSLKLL